MKGTYVYVKTDIMEKLDIRFMVSKDKDEITVITQKENIKNLKVLELVCRVMFTLYIVKIKQNGLKAISS